MVPAIVFHSTGHPMGADRKAMTIRVRVPKQFAMGGGSVVITSTHTVQFNPGKQLPPKQKKKKENWVDTVLEEQKEERRIPEATPEPEGPVVKVKEKEAHPLGDNPVIQWLEGLMAKAQQPAAQPAKPAAQPAKPAAKKKKAAKKAKKKATKKTPVT